MIFTLLAASFFNGSIIFLHIKITVMYVIKCIYSSIEGLDCVHIPPPAAALPSQQIPVAAMCMQCLKTLENHVGTLPLTGSGLSGGALPGLGRSTGLLITGASPAVSVPEPEPWSFCGVVNDCLNHSHFCLNILFSFQAHRRSTVQV